MKIECILNLSPLVEDSLVKKRKTKVNLLGIVRGEMRVNCNFCGFLKGNSCHCWVLECFIIWFSLERDSIQNLNRLK